MKFVSIELYPRAWPSGITVKMAPEYDP